MWSRIKASVSFWAWMRCAWCRAIARWRGSSFRFSTSGLGSVGAPLVVEGCPRAEEWPRPRPRPRPRELVPLVEWTGWLFLCAESEAAACVNGSDVRE